MSAEANSERPVEVTFTSVSGVALPATIEAFAVDLRKNADEPCRIRLSLAPEVFAAAVEEEAFNLLPGALVGDGLSALSPDSRVVVDARLREPAIRGFVRRHGSLDRLFEEMGTDEALLRADSWLALTMVQEIDLPGEIGDGAHASVGGETMWNREPSSAAPAGRIAEVARGTLAELGYDVTPVDAQLCRVLVEQGGHQWPLLVHCDEAERTCVCWSVYPRLAAPKQRGPVASFLLEFNYEVSVGSFEMDPADGEIRFRTGIDVGSGLLDAELFRRLVARNLGGMGRAIALLDAYFA